MNFYYVVQIESECRYVDDSDHRPYTDYWLAVGAAMEEAQSVGRNMRVVKRAVAPDDEPVFEIGGQAR